MGFAVPEVRIIKGVGRKFINAIDHSWKAEHHSYQTA